MGTTTSGVGWSRSDVALDAGREAATAALERAGGQAPVFTIVYGTVLYDQPELLRGVRSVIPEGPLVGASTQGLSTGGLVEESDRLVGVMVVCGSGLTARSAVVTEIGPDGAAVGQRLADALGTSPSLPLLAWYDPLTGLNVQAMLDALGERGFGQVLGGGSGQPFGPRHQTYQYHDTQALSGAAVALALEGELELLHELTHGAEPLGVELTITAAHDNVIETIDGRPAFDVLEELLGDTVRAGPHELVHVALGRNLAGEASNHEGSVILALYSVDAQSKVVVLQAPVPAGTRVQLCHRTREAVQDRALGMAERLRRRLAGRRPVGLLSFECGARPSPFLGREAARDEVLKMQEILGKDIPWLGMYAWSEVAPAGGQTHLHSYTFPLVALCEPAGADPPAAP